MAGASHHCRLVHVARNGRGSGAVFRRSTSLTGATVISTALQMRAGRRSVRYSHGGQTSAHCSDRHQFGRNFQSAREKIGSRVELQCPGITGQSLLERARSGSAHAWEDLAEICQPLIRKWLAGCAVNPDDVDDVAQDVATVLLKELSEFEHNGRLGAFRSEAKKVGG